MPELLLHARADRDFRTWLLRHGWRVAVRDGVATDAEFHCLANVARDMGADQDEFYWTSVPFYRPPPDNQARIAAARLLGLTADAPPLEVKHAYRRLALTYHPDRHPNVGAGLRQLAAERFAAITQGYKLLSEPNETPLLYGLGADVAMIATPLGGDLVRCYFCFTKCRLPDREHHDSARCPNCQALLLFECQMAEAFLGILKERQSR